MSKLDCKEEDSTVSCKEKRVKIVIKLLSILKSTKMNSSLKNETKTILHVLHIVYFNINSKLLVF